jgi:succinyl-diaminopimelate desuccinylase
LHLERIGIDIRSIPGLDHSRIQEHLKAELGGDISLEPIVDVGAVWTDPSSPWIKEVYEIMRDVTCEDGGSGPRTAPYFTDASALTPALDPPTIIVQAKRRKLARRMSIVLFNG